MFNWTISHINVLLSNLRAARVLSSTCTCIIIIIIIYSINPLGTVWWELFYIETFPQIANTLNAITEVKIKYYSYHFFISVQLNVNF